MDMVPFPFSHQVMLPKSLNGAAMLNQICKQIYTHPLSFSHSFESNMRTLESAPPRNLPPNGKPELDRIELYDS